MKNERDYSGVSFVTRLKKVYQINYIGLINIYLVWSCKCIGQFSNSQKKLLTLLTPILLDEEVMQLGQNFIFHFLGFGLRKVKNERDYYGVSFLTRSKNMYQINYIG